MNDIIQFAYSVQGYNHIKVNKVCQDSSREYNDEQMSIIIVADGHGGNDYPRSDKGANIAVECAEKSIQTFVRNVENIDEYNYRLILTDLARNILKEWHDAVKNDLTEKPFSEFDLKNISEQYRLHYLYQSNDLDDFRGKAKAYGTTLIAVCVTNTYWFGLQIGDGKCVIFRKDGTTEEPIDEDPKCHGNITTSICDEDALEEFHFCFGTVEEIPAAIFIGSDGVDNSYPFPPMEKVRELYASVMQICMEHGERMMKQEFQAYLSTISKKGSGDDISVCGWLDRNSYIDALESYRLQPLIDKRNKLNEDQKALDLEAKIDKETIDSYGKELKRIKAAREKKEKQLKEKIKEKESYSAIENVLNKAEKDKSILVNDLNIRKAIIDYFPVYQEEMSFLFDQGILQNAFQIYDEPETNISNNLVAELDIYQPAYTAWIKLLEQHFDKSFISQFEEDYSKLSKGISDLDEKKVQINEDYQRAKLRQMEKRKKRDEIGELTKIIEKKKKSFFEKKYQ